MEFLKEAWAIIFLISVPFAGCIGFFVHVLALRKSSLETQKLRYEIKKLKRELDESKGLIRIADLDQIEKYGGWRGVAASKPKSNQLKVDYKILFIYLATLLVLSLLVFIISQLHPSVPILQYIKGEIPLSSLFASFCSK